MQLDQLKYVVEVAKTESISEASTNLHISQSAISQSITQLETELGVKIFVRSRQGTLPTPDGKKIIKKAYEVLNKARELEELARSCSSTLTGDLRLSTFPGLMVTMIRSLHLFKNAYPKVNIEIKEKGSSDIINDLLQNKADIGLAVLYDDLYHQLDTLEFNQLMEGQVRVYVRKDSALAFSQKATPSEIVNYPVVLYKSKLSTIVVKKLEEQYGPLNILYVSESSDSIIKAILEGLAISFIPEFALRDDPNVVNGDVVGLEIDEMNYKILFGWIWSKRRDLPQPAIKFIDYLNDELKKNQLI